MNKNTEVCEIFMDLEYGTETFSAGRQFDAYLPYGFDNIDEWLEGRQIAKHRRQIHALMKECGIDTKSGFISMTRCLSLTDTFWIREENSHERWETVSLYRNAFDETIARIAFDGVGMYGKQFTTTTPELGTDGSFEKCWIRDEKDDVYLLKRGSSGFSNAGFEPYSEKLASDLADAIGYSHVRYSLTRHHNKLASRCLLFTNEQTGFLNAAAFFGRNMPVAKLGRVMDSLGFHDDFCHMLVFDAICCNVDRHMGNFGFLIDNTTGKLLALAPLFDHNQALLPYLTETDDLAEYLKIQGPRLGDDFVSTARSVLTTSMRTDLINLKDFAYEDPGYEFPKWKLDAINRLKEDQIRLILQ